MKTKSAFPTFKKIFVNHAWISIPLAILFFVIFAASLVLADVTYYEKVPGGYGYKSANNSVGAITKYDSTCAKITNNSTNTYFIPANTKAEWDAFNAHLPNGVATSGCCAANAGSACYSGCYQGVWDCAGTTCISATTPVADGTDPGNACGGYTCSTLINGWSGNDCMKYTGATASNGTCNGAGACNSLANSCSGSATSTGCGNSGCKKDSACVNGAPIASYDTAAEVCYTDNAQHGCATGYTCSSTSASCSKCVAYSVSNNIYLYAYCYGDPNYCTWSSSHVQAYWNSKTTPACWCDNCESSWDPPISCGGNITYYVSGDKYGGITCDSLYCTQRYAVCQYIDN